MRSPAKSLKSEKKLPKPNNVVTVPTTLDEFFKWWCIFLRPFVNLTNREVDVVASFLKQRWELSKSILDPTLLDKLVMSDDVRARVRKECNMTAQYLHVVINNLRKNKVIENDIINPRLIPNIREDDNGCFQLLVLFKTDSKK
jgi:hypothetical protein